MNKHQFKYVFSILAVTNLLLPLNTFGNVGNLSEVTIEPFPVLSWVTPKVTEAQLKLYKDAGFTVMTIGPIESDYQTLKKYWKGNYILFKEWRAAMSYDKMIDFHGDDPNLIGFLVGDEPNCAKIDEYKDVFDRFRNRYPEKICLVNLFPTYVGETRLGCSYFNYIDKFFEKLNPRYLSLDYYPCFWFDVEMPDYYLNLEILRHKAKENNSKQIGFVQVYASNVCREVSESDISWQVYSLLSYGCKGLWYFYYRHPAARSATSVANNSALSEVYNMSSAPGKKSKPYKPVCVFGNGVLDVNDNPSYAYPFVKQVNSEVKAWGKLLTNLTNTAVRHAGNELVPGYSPFTPAGIEVFRPGVDPVIENLKWNYDINKDGFIVSYFKDCKGNDYVMLVNKKHGEYLSRRQAAITVDIIFKENIQSVFGISVIDGSESKYALQSKVLRRRIDGGGAILFRIEYSK